MVEDANTIFITFILGILFLKRKVGPIFLMYLEVALQNATEQAFYFLKHSPLIYFILLA
jgi:hypothetical protein